jgi:beta-glucosidase-like glycosyl hydrolase
VITVAVVGSLMGTSSASGLVMMDDPQYFMSQTDVSKSSLEDATSPPYYPSPFGGRSAGQEWTDAYEKAYKFVDQLSLAEKVNLTSGIGWMNGPCMGNTGPIPRLNFRGMCMQDGPLGVRKTEFNTAFPPGITVGSTFNKQLFYDRGKAVGLEHKNKGVDVMLGPAVGPIGLKAAGGRIWEGFGADPYLQGVAGANTVRGIQDQGIMANAKHWIANEQEHFRQISEWKYQWGFSDIKGTASSNVDDRTLHEIYAWPFADMIRAGVGSVMCSYNQINNSQGCQNSYVLNNVLKEQLGFPGFVMSDWAALHSGVASILAGTDMSMPGGNMGVPPESVEYFGKQLTVSVLNGTIPTWRLDDMAARIVAAYYKVGLDKTWEENPDGPNFSAWTLDTEDLLYKGVGEGPIGVVNKHVDVRSEFSNQIAEQVATEAVVLLKNKNDSLPLLLGGDGAIRKVGILGVGAGPSPEGPNCVDMACSQGVMASGWGSGTAEFPFIITPIDGINSRAIRKGVTVDYNFGEDDWDSFDRIAQHSDVNIIFGLTNSGEGFMGVDDNFGDRKNTSLWHKADEQILRAASLNSNNVVVINSVGPVNLEKWIDHPNVTAVLFSAPQGQYAGEATAKVLFGEVNPSGRLPFTIARNDDDYVPLVTTLPADGIPQDNFDTGLNLDYRNFDVQNIEPRFEFGYGLSFSNWTFSDLAITTVQVPSEHLPPPPSIGAVPKFRDEIPPAKDLLHPTNVPRYDNYMYPYIDNVKEAVPKGDYPYPEGYSTVPVEASSLAGGAPGGNPALWDVVYQVSSTVHNNGPYGGAYVAQLYVGYPDSDKYPSPPRQLRGFEKVSVNSNDSTSINFDIKRRDLSVWDVETQSWIVQRGEYTIYVGSSSRKLELVGSFTI